MMNRTKEKSRMKRLFAIFLLILVLLGRIEGKEIFAAEAAGVSVSAASVEASEVNGEVTIWVVHDFDGGGAEVILQKEGAYVKTVPIGTASKSFAYDLDSAEYDSFYIKKVNDSQAGNKTVPVTTAGLTAKKDAYGRSFAVQPGGWIGTDSVRAVTVRYCAAISIKHDFTGGATVCYVSGDTLVKRSALPSDRMLFFDLESTEYDGFYIEETGTTNIGNKTVVLNRETITAALGELENSSGGGYFAYCGSRRL